MSDTTRKPVAERARDQAAKMADDVAEAASNKAKSEAQTARDTAAYEARKAANAADAASDEFDSGSVQARALEEVARRIDDLADEVRNTDINRAARAVGDAARNNPLLFVAGAALAGFAATRFLKARDPGHRSGSFHGDPWDQGRHQSDSHAQYRTGAYPGQGAP